MTKQIQNFLKDESGAAAVEYGLLVSCIALVIIPSVKSVGQQLVLVFTQISNAL
jgi:pilus assembly protein Flp/PilA